MAMPTSPPRILVVGGDGPDGGQAGPAVAARLARRLTPTEASITLVVPRRPLTDRALLGDALSGALAGHRVSRALADTELAAGLSGVEQVAGRVARLDHTHRVARLRPDEGPARDLHYDVVVLAPAPAPVVTPTFEGLRVVADATDVADLREHVLARLDRAEHSRDGRLRDRVLTFVVLGSGGAEVHLLVRLAETLRRATTDLTTVRRTDLRLILVGAEDTVLPGTVPALGEAIVAQLRADGIEVHLGVDVGPTATGVRLSDGTEIETDTVVALPDPGHTPTVAASDLATGPDGDLPLGPDLQLLDVAAAWALPPLPAGRSSRHAAEALADNLVTVLRGGRPEDYRAPGVLATTALGPGRGAARIGPVTLTGRPAWLLDRVATLAELPTTRRRAAVLAGWTTAGVAARRRRRSAPSGGTAAAEVVAPT